MKLQFFTVIFVFLFLNLTFAQQKLRNSVKVLVSEKDYRNASIGIHVADLQTGATIFGLNQNRLHVPASVMKIISSASALEILGPDFRFETRIGYSGTIQDSVLNGNLILIGGGDPALGSEYFESNYTNPGFLEVWAEKIKSAGIRQVNGKLIADNSKYDSEVIPPTWSWDDIGNYYGVGANALTVYDNMFRVEFSSAPNAGETTQIKSLKPEMADLQVTNEVTSSDINRDNAYVFGSPLDNTRKIIGTIPKNRDSFSIKAANHTPQKTLSEEFLKALKIKGIVVKDGFECKKCEITGFNLVYVQKSPTLAEIIKVLNHESVNLFAEHMVMQVAAEKTGTGNRETGIQINMDYWKNKGIDLNEMFLEDGSGLSHYNALSPECLTKILCYMAVKSKHSYSFLESLPQAGKGTLTVFDPKIYPGKTLQAKSGSVTRVRCYAGFLQQNSGKKVAFAFMFNNFSGTNSQLIKKIDGLLQILKEGE